jgi:hypothetical protein
MIVTSFKIFFKNKSYLKHTPNRVTQFGTDRVTLTEIERERKKKKKEIIQFDFLFYFFWLSL